MSAGDTRRLWGLDASRSVVAALWIDC